MNRALRYEITKQADQWTIEFDGHPLMRCRGRLVAVRTVRDAMRLLASDAGDVHFGSVPGRTRSRSADRRESAVPRKPRVAPGSGHFC
jgi:hypothetical protein